jgi:general secretion pathway protein C
LTGSRPWMAPALVTASAAVCAVAASTLLGWAVAPEESVVADAPLVAASESAPSRSLPPRTPRKLDEQVYIDGILARNLFDATKIGVEEEAGDGAVDAPSTLNATLIGTIVAEQPAHSAAFISIQGQQSGFAYGVGQLVQGAEVLEILKDRVRLRVGAREEWLTMGDEKVPVSTSAPAGAATDSGVVQISEFEYKIPRALLDEQLNDLEGLSGMGRSMLHRGPDGQFDGYRLSALRRGSLPDQLGIRNGDIVHKVNDMPLDSVQGAMQAFSTLQNGSSFKFEVTRRGQPVTLSYTVE